MNMKSSARYGLAVFSVGLVVCLKLLFMNVLGEGAPFLMFFGAILLTASYAGKKPAWAATLLSALVANYFFMRPSNEVAISAQSLLQTVVFLLEGFLISEVSSRWRDSEREARRQSELLRTTLLSIGDGVVATDANGVVTLMNPVAENLIGYGQEEAEGNPLSDIFKIISETTRQAVGSPIDEVLEKGNIVGLANHTVLVSRSGAEIPIDDSGAPIRGSDGVLVGAVLVFRDITERREAAREMEELAHRLSTVLNNIGDAFVILDRDWRYVYLNEQAAKIRNKPREELLGRPLWEGIPDAASLTTYQEFERAVRDNVSVHFEEHSPLRHLWFSIDAYPTPEGLTVFARDVTGQKRAAEELRISNTRFRRLYESNLIGIVFWNVNTGVTDANDEYFRLVGMTRKEFEQHGILFRGLTPPEFREIENKVVDRMLADGTSGLYEKEYVHADGRRVPVLIGLSLLDESTQDGVAFALDITDRKTAERRFRQLTDHAPVLIWIAGTGGSRVFFNKPWLAFTGRTMEQEKGDGWAEGMHPDDLQRCPAIFLASFAARQSFRTEYRLRRHDGQWRWILDDGQPMYSISGEFEGFIGSCIDITDRRMAEDALQSANTALRRSNEDLRQFAYAASHDLQEPLRMVNLYSQLLAKRYKGKLDADADQFIEFTTSGAMRMHALVHDLLAFVQAADSPVEKVVPANAEIVFESTLASIRTALAGANVTHDPLPELAVHRQHLTQLFQNLIGNAVKYRGTELPEVHVSVRRDGAFWIISVKDNGIGIDPKYHQRIFGIFKRLHRDEYPGTGIGLAICSKIVERYGGRIWVDSEVGKGAEFLFTLPAA